VIRLVSLKLLKTINTFCFQIARETTGSAEIVEDPHVCYQFAIKNRNPKTVLRIRAEKILVHCGKSLVRAGLWEPNAWPEARPVASLNEVVRDHSGVEVGPITQAAVDEMYKKTIY